MVRAKNDTKGKKPSFFKVIIPGYSTEQLTIPPPFLKLIRKDLSDKAMLSFGACSEQSWIVTVSKTTRGLYFKDGWQEFLKNNSVEEGDFLVFEYEGDMQFSIQIYDNSCCERDSFPDTVTHKNSTFSECKKVHPGTPRKSGIGCSENPLQLNSRNDNSDNIAKKRLPTRPRKIHIGCYKRPGILKSSKQNSVADTVPKKRLPGRPRKSHIGCSKCPCPPNSSKETSVPDNIVEQSAESFKSNYPHCTKVVKKTYCMYSFPTSFYREHLSSCPDKVVSLKIAGGQKWYQVKLVRSCATAFLSKGWSEFAYANQIKVGNACVFEAVGGNKLVVHVFQH